MRKGPVLLLVLLAAMLMPVSSQAMAGTEKSPQAKAKVVEIDTLLESPAEYVGDVVSVSGTITRVKGNEFLLVANGESVVIDCGPPWYHTVEIDDGEVTVTGQVDRAGPPWAKRDHLEIEIDACEIEGISVRDCDFDGPPAWAGGPFRHFDMGPPWMEDGRDVGPPWARNGGNAGPSWARAGISR